MGIEMGAADPVPQSRRRRWLLAGVILVVLLTGYAVALFWFAQRVQNDVQRNVREAPVVEDYQHRSD